MKAHQKSLFEGVLSVRRFHFQLSGGVLNGRCVQPYYLKLLSTSSCNTVLTLLLNPSNKGHCLPAVAGLIPSRDGTHWRARRTQWRPECRWHLIYECCPWALRQTSTMRHNEFVTLSFLNWTPFLSDCPLLAFGPHMSFISIFRNRETFATTECDRFYRLSFTVALGGGEAVLTIC